MEYLDKIGKVLCFLIECLSPWIAMERRNDNMAKRLIIMVIIDAKENDDNKTFVYIKGRQKRE